MMAQQPIADAAAPRRFVGAGAPAEGGLSISVEDGLVRVVGTGFWSSDCVDAHFRELRRVVALGRHQHRRFKVLVDLSDSTVQTQDSSQRIEQAIRSIWMSGDRIALVVRPGLARLQISRIIDGHTHRIFDRIDLARRWLDRD